MPTARIWFSVLSLAVVWAPIASTSSQESIFERIRAEHQSLEKSSHREGIAPASLEPSSIESQPIDVKHYKLQIQLATELGAFSGTVTITGETTGPADSVDIDAQPNLNIDSVMLDGATPDFRRKSNRVVISFPNAFPAGRTFAIAIRYHSNPTGSLSNGTGMTWARHGPGSAPVMATHSEPFGAPLWYPCIDNPADKATAEVEITVPEGYQTASNGVLDRIQTNPDHTQTCFWREDSPLATYLLSVAATNYERIEDRYTALDGVTAMPLVYYVYPEHVDRAGPKLAVTGPAMKIYAELFGEYPFLGEKYGVAEFPFAGAMEHQTITGVSFSIMSSAGDARATLVHELSHHWWGDLVTMRTWDDIWLNEGFATYCEVLFFERFSNLDPGELMSRSYDDGQVDGALRGTVTAENLDRPFDDQGAIYRKGAWVLHMMRHILGDEKFFTTLRTYRERHAFSNASTKDFQEACEEQYGATLDWFFKQWIYAPSRPVYKVASDISGADAAGNYAVTLVIKQKQSHEIPGRDTSVYIMPLDLTIHYADGTSETRVVFNNARKQKFSVSTSKRPVDVGVDEGHWVLKKLKGS